MGYFGDHGVGRARGVGTVRIPDQRMEGYFGRLGQDSWGGINDSMSKIAQDAVAYYDRLAKIVPMMTGDFRTNAEAVLAKKRMPSNFFEKIFGGGRWNLPELRAMMQEYINAREFLRLDPKTLQVSTSRRDRLLGFQEAVNELEKVIPIRDLPTKVVSQTADVLLAQTRILADAARKSGRVEDAIAARELASVTASAGASENRADIKAEADKIKAEMAALAARGGAPAAVPATGMQDEGLPWGTIALVGGGVVVLLGVAYFLTKK
jgi:hypothetical protein